ncbi:hypothetical protein FQA47_013518 [Oryzias melastigma]|uniref:Uncharacterized protein n=1 Tax=Oryzias melastigma TaxID=30732 RepID=A0A834EYW9_ORYME|nr:hypothetical protein FQA47_013518 [Oryzias melastigma]
MFLIFFNVFYVFLGSACGLLHKKVCSGDSVEIDLHAHPFYKRLYFHPKEGGAMELLMANQEAKDPRLKVSTYSAKLTQLTEKDSGKFVIGRNFGGVTDVLSLTVSDCSLNISLLYGEELVRDIPSSAELLEFTPFHGLEEPQLMWERANPKMNYGGRGKIIKDVFIISKVTQKDNGFYNFKQKDKSMVLLATTHCNR